jgi:hypothetical protein
MHDVLTLLGFFTTAGSAWLLICASAAPKPEEPRRKRREFATPESGKPSWRR